MSHFNTPWDPSRTQKGVGPVGRSEIPAPTKVDYSRYRLGSRLGPTGQVYEAYNARFPGRLVVKLFPFATGLAPAAVRAFTGEASKVADLRHPHIVQVFHPGAFDDGTPFVAMERLFGQTLEERIAGRGALPVSELLPIVRGLASALSAVHALGIVHRELRLDNVFIADLVGYELGFAKLLDFGVSRLTSAARAAGRTVESAPGEILAPEQRRGMVDVAPVEVGDHRTDQFALAALTYRLLTGTDPSAGLQLGPEFERVGGDGGRPSDFFVRSAPEVEAVLAKGLSRLPENRFDSVAHFFHAIEAALIRTAAVSTPAVLRLDVPVDHSAQAEQLSRARSEAPTRVAIDNQPGSLTQQFFVEGERQEANQWDDSPLAEEVVVDEGAMAFDSFDRVPKRRAPLIGAGLIVFVALGITAWATGWLSPVERSSAEVGKTLPPLEQVRSPPPERVTSMNEVPAVRAPPPAIPAAPASSPAAALPSPVATPPAPRATIAPPSNAAQPTTPSLPAPVVVRGSPSAIPVPTARVAPAATTAVAPEARRPVASSERVATRPAGENPPSAGLRGGSPLPRAPALIEENESSSPSDRQAPPLRGYVWSPERRRLIHARLPALQSESPPAPP